METKKAPFSRNFAEKKGKGKKRKVLITCCVQRDTALSVAPSLSLPLSHSLAPNTHTHTETPEARGKLPHPTPPPTPPLTCSVITDGDSSSDSLYSGGFFSRSPPARTSRTNCTHNAIFLLLSLAKTIFPSWLSTRDSGKKCGEHRQRGSIVTQLVY